MFEIFFESKNIISFIKTNMNAKTRELFLVSSYINRKGYVEGFFFKGTPLYVNIKYDMQLGTNHGNHHFERNKTPNMETFLVLSTLKTLYTNLVLLQNVFFFCAKIHSFSTSDWLFSRKETWHFTRNIFVIFIRILFKLFASQILYFRDKHKK